MMKSESAFTTQLVKRAIKLTRETQEHADGCQCADCLTLFALSLSLNCEGREAIRAEVCDLEARRRRISEGAALVFETRTHPIECPCERCADCLRILRAMQPEERAELKALAFSSVQEFYDSEIRRRDDDLLTAAIREVVERDDSEELPDISTQVVALILSSDEYEPLRESIFSRLFN